MKNVHAELVFTPSLVQSLLRGSKTKVIENNIRPTNTSLRSTRDSFKSKARHIWLEETIRHRKIRDIQNMMNRRQGILSLLAFVSILIAVAINELCVEGDYIPHLPSLSEEIALEQTAQNPRKCTKPLGEDAKLLQSLITAVILGLLLVQHSLRKKIASMQTSTSTATVRKDEFSSSPKIIRRLRLTLELLINFVHNLPFVHYDMAVKSDGTVIYYRLDSILAVATFVRFYHIFQWMHMKVVYRYFNLEVAYILRDYTIVEWIQNSWISVSLLAVKILIKRQAIAVICIFIGITVLSIGYMTRVAEGPAYTEHSVYLWDQLWIIYACVRGREERRVGYGTVVITDFGKFTVCMAMGMGPVAVAFVTATANQGIRLNNNENFMMSRADNNHLKLRVLTSAARVIQHWWRGIKAEAGGGAVGGAGGRLSRRLSLKREWKRVRQGELLYRELYNDMEMLRRGVRSCRPSAMCKENPRGAGQEAGTSMAPRKSASPRRTREQEEARNRLIREIEEVSKRLVRVDERLANLVRISERRRHDG
ncbi:hypothetical protein GUITHDRAFT_140090 [Guillardia theta CCMP2712]|uniref:Potassium channel domain-containing protein n=1 Tax=Guillardia theta (strain CCMP2712) TaxID=905079 RepID=L1J6K5_GUITC|nr:hypothetical protein GUITHDRAFT_140090 [Guillardia theta CCMP2712]EKX43952.1 hypothetical protein GUITHDRAFT_140090 [Guillardia theta CCMP2712]|eukprot:XP_005830932.1 hypothetical protein GUITHDRAFT_140090 [Guillardia theta CCMP2712]